DQQVRIQVRPEPAAHEVQRQEKNRREKIAHVHGAEKIAFLALKDDAANRTRIVHGKRSLEDLSLQAARAAKANDGPEARKEPDTLGRRICRSDHAEVLAVPKLTSFYQLWLVRLADVRITSASD